MNGPIQAGGEAMLAKRANRPAGADIPISLTASIYRYKAAKYAHLARQVEAEGRGRSEHVPIDYWREIEVLENWDLPANSLGEAMEALEFAIEDYEVGDTPRILAMMKAALLWMNADYLRRAEA